MRSEAEILFRVLEEAVHERMRLNFIKIRKEKLKLTQTEMSRKLNGVPSISAINNYEKKKQNFSLITIYRICFVFNLNINELIPPKEDIFESQDKRELKIKKLKTNTDWERYTKD
jgi:transcriptional regulator with XRE-family HTH domain